MSWLPGSTGDPGTGTVMAATPNAPGHDEWLLDEALAETFPASDPPAVVQPGSTVAVHYASRRPSRKLPRASPTLWMIVALSIACIAWLRSRRA
jgi:hypothetical protein